jgi:glycosyltransferase involved in cell wall biosynthesis
MKSRILFVHNHPAKFVQLDLLLLRERYDVCEWYQRTRVVNLLTLAHAVSQSDLVFGWFASWHTLFPVVLARLFRKPSVLVVGGYDTANMPEIGYGSMRGGFKRWIARTTMHSATKLIAFSEFSRLEAIRHACAEEERISSIYIGVPADSRRAVEKELLVITAGNVDYANLRRKGIEPFVRAAASLPDIPFMVIGAWRDDSIRYLQSFTTPNVKFTGWVSDEELRNCFSRARVYVQASRHEGFGLSVAEAMMSECVPVVTRAGALPEVVGECGVYVDSPTPQAIADGVRRALTLDNEWGHRARERIIREFPLFRRRIELSAFLDQLLGQHV